MTWVKGQSGNASNKDWREAIRLALADKHGSDWKRALRLIASKLINAAEKGDMTAIREIGDRIDGKPGQSIEMAIVEKPEANVYPLGLPKNEAEERTIN